MFFVPTWCLQSSAFLFSKLTQNADASPQISHRRMQVSLPSFIIVLALQNRTDNRIPLLNISSIRPSPFRPFHFTLAVFFNSLTGFLHIHLSLSGHPLILSHSLLFNLNLILNSPSLNLPFTKFRSLRLVSLSIYSFSVSFDSLLFALNLQTRASMHLLACLCVNA